MPAPKLPWIVEPEELERQLGQEAFLLVDLCKPEIHAQSHIPGALHLDYAQIVAVNKPVMGLLPGESQLNEVFSSIGLTPEHHVVAYDDEGGGRAARLLWTLEARPADEYLGSKRFAERGGHIPGAVNLDWMQTMDRDRGLRFKPAQALRVMLTSLGVTPDKEVVCYCQSHHRSAHSCMMLKSLGYPRVRGYPGSWSDWGNSPDTPVE